MSAVFASASVKAKLPPGTSTVQKLLDENTQLIKTIVDYQSSGQMADCAKLQEKLHRNLMYLASVADAGQNLINELQAPADAAPLQTTSERVPGKENVEPPAESPKQQPMTNPTNPSDPAAAGQFVNPNFPQSGGGEAPHQSPRHTSTPQALYPPQQQQQNQRPNASPMPPPTSTYQQHMMLPQQPHQQAIPPQQQQQPPQQQQQQQIYFAQQQQMQYGGQMGPGGQMVRAPVQQGMPEYQQQPQQQYYNPQMQNTGYYQQGMPPQQQPVHQYGQMSNQPNFAVSGGNNPPGNVMYGSGYAQPNPNVRGQMAPGVYATQSQMPPNQQMMPQSQGQPQQQQFHHGGQQQQPYSGYPPQQQPHPQQMPSAMYSMPPSSSRN